MKTNSYWWLLRILLTVFIAILIPVYWHYYGPQNFLWLSDIGLLLTVIALWMNSNLLISIAAVDGLLVELVWNVDFFINLIFNKNLIDLADYMFDSSYPITLRALSMFHVVVPIIWLVYLARYGYDKRALFYGIGLYWIVALSTYMFTSPKENINWVFLPQVYGIQETSPLMWVAFLCIVFPLFIFLPTHYILKKLFKSA